MQKSLIRESLTEQDDRVETRIVNRRSSLDTVKVNLRKARETDFSSVLFFVAVLLAALILAASRG